MAKISKLLYGVSLLVSLVFADPGSVYYMVDGSSPYCFIEYLPSETVVVADFRAETLSPATNQYQQDPKISVSVDVLEKNSGKLVVSQKLGTVGPITFTSNTFGEHRICFSVGNPSVGWFHSEKTRFYLNFFIGSEAVNDKYSSSASSKVQDMIHVANSWLQDILTEQEYQRNKESMFLSFSRSISSKLNLWIVLQLLTIGGLGYWQITHLRRFFVNKKLV